MLSAREKLRTSPILDFWVEKGREMGHDIHAMKGRDITGNGGQLHEDDSEVWV